MNRIIIAALLALTDTGAVPVIEAHEWLGTTGQVDRFFAAFTADGRIMGMVGFTTTRHRYLDETGTVILAGGCKTPNGHRHTSSWLLARAFRVLRAEGTKRVVAYADSLAGERGTVYSAANMVRADMPHKFRQCVRPLAAAWRAQLVR